MKLYDEHIVKTRAPHTCSYCLKTIPAGTECRTESGIFEDFFFRRWCCEDCQQIAGAVWEYCDYECGSISDTTRECIEECLYNADLRKRISALSFETFLRHAERLHIIFDREAMQR